MNVLGIETSCDETAASVVKGGRKVLSNIVSSSIRFHKKHGGIVPEIAFRRQLETITEVVDSAVREAAVGLNQISLVSVTAMPGLFGSLSVGVSFARAMSLACGIPLLEVDHLYGHIYASFLSKEAPDFPFVSLIVSGGHTSLFYVEGFDRIKLLGSTLDDACGEAFDKVAKILGLGYPGGPLIERLSRKGNDKKIKFNCCDTKHPLDFSFSGIKTAVLYYARFHPPTGQLDKADIAASFQKASIDALIRKSFSACKLKKAPSLVVGGGVAANLKLREEFYLKARECGIKVYFPSKEFCMDNAAMVAGFGYQLFRKTPSADRYCAGVVSSTQDTRR